MSWIWAIEFSKTRLRKGLFGYMVHKLRLLAQMSEELIEFSLESLMEYG